MTELTIEYLINNGFNPFYERIKNAYAEKDLAFIKGNLVINSFNYGKAFKLLGSRIKYIEELNDIIKQKSYDRF